MNDEGVCITAPATPGLLNITVMNPGINAVQDRSTNSSVPWNGHKHGACRGHWRQGGHSTLYGPRNGLIV